MMMVVCSVPKKQKKEARHNATPVLRPSDSTFSLRPYGRYRVIAGRFACFRVDHLVDPLDSVLTRALIVEVTTLVDVVRADLVYNRLPWDVIVVQIQGYALASMVLGLLF